MPQEFPFGAHSTADQVLAGIDLSRKRFVVTGCSSGIGFETMHALLANGAHVIGLARTFDGAQSACSAAGPLATPVACDLSNLASVGAAVEFIRHLPGQLDGIITNAGIAYLPTLQTRQGVELQFLVDHLAHFLLVNRLADRVRSGTGRIVIVSSDASITKAPVEGVMFDNLDGRRFYDPATFFGQAKLAASLYAKELSRRLASRGVCVNSLHPGATRGTGFHRHQPSIRRFMQPVAGLFLKSPAQGAATQTLLAASPRVAGVSGQYWSDCRISGGNPLLADSELAKRLWNTSERLVERTGGEYATPARSPRRPAAAGSSMVTVVGALS